MTHLLVIKGKLPGLNEYTSACRTNPHKGASMKAKAETIVINAIRAQMRRIHVQEPVRISYRWYEPNRRRDLDNISSFGRKVIQDALVKAHVLENDGWRNIVGFKDSFFVDKGDPRIEVEITEA